LPRRANVSFGLPVRKNGRHVLVEAPVNFILPFVIYTYAEAPLGDVRALLASSAPPILWSLVEFARHGESTRCRCWW